MNVFVVMVTPEAAHSKISQQAYKTFKEAETFILSRTGCTKQIKTYKWRDEDYTEYEIVEVRV